MLLVVTTRVSMVESVGAFTAVFVGEVSVVGNFSFTIIAGSFVLVLDVFVGVDDCVFVVIFNIISITVLILVLVAVQIIMAN